MLTLHMTLPALFDNAFVHVYTSVLPELPTSERAYQKLYSNEED